MNCSTDIKTQEEVVYCHICDRELDLINAAISQDQVDSIYICFGTIKQKIFVYGKYSRGLYGAPALSGQYTKAECESKACEKDITDFLEGRNETEYSRLIDCHRGKMECSILTAELVEKRKQALLDGRHANHFPDYTRKRKYFCRHDAEEMNFTCTCGKELIQLNSDRYRELMGMEDTEFMETYLPALLNLK